MDLHSIIKTLSQDEKAELVRLLRQDLNVPRIDIIWSAINRDQLILCPHCNSNDIYGHGGYRGRKRYKCKACKRTFNDFTGTAIALSLIHISEPTRLGMISYAV